MTYPPSGNMPSIAPKTRSSSMPSQPSGIEYRSIDAPTLPVSRALPLRQPAWIPSHTPTATDSTVAGRTRITVGHTRPASTETTDLPEV